MTAFGQRSAIGTLVFVETHAAEHIRDALSWQAVMRVVLHFVLCLAHQSLALFVQSMPPRKRAALTAPASAAAPRVTPKLNSYQVSALMSVVQAVGLDRWQRVAYLMNGILRGITAETAHDLYHEWKDFGTPQPQPVVLAPAPAPVAAAAAPVVAAAAPIAVASASAVAVTAPQPQPPRAVVATASTPATAAPATVAPASGLINPFALPSTAPAVAGLASHPFALPPAGSSTAPTTTAGATGAPAPLSFAAYLPPATTNAATGAGTAPASLVLAPTGSVASSSGLSNPSLPSTAVASTAPAVAAPQQSQPPAPIATVPAVAVGPSASSALATAAGAGANFAGVTTRLLLRGVHDAAEAGASQALRAAKELHRAAHTVTRTMGRVEAAQAEQVGVLNVLSSAMRDTTRGVLEHAVAAPLRRIERVVDKIDHDLENMQKLQTQLIRNKRRRVLPRPKCCTAELLRRDSADVPAELEAPFDQWSAATVERFCTFMRVGPVVADAVSGKTGAELASWHPEDWVRQGVPAEASGTTKDDAQLFGSFIWASYYEKKDAAARKPAAAAAAAATAEEAIDVDGGDSEDDGAVHAAKRARLLAIDSSPPPSPSAAVPAPAAAAASSSSSAALPARLSAPAAAAGAAAAPAAAGAAAAPAAPHGQQPLAPAVLAALALSVPAYPANQRGAVSDLTQAEANFVEGKTVRQHQVERLTTRIRAFSPRGIGVLQLALRVAVLRLNVEQRLGRNTTNYKRRVDDAAKALMDEFAKQQVQHAPEK